MSPDPGFHAYVDRWHEFYLLTGTAAVTLIGLLFVALSFNLEALLHERRVHLLDVARQTMFAYLAVLFVSLLFLIPDTSHRILGMAIAVVGTMLALYTARLVLRLRGRGQGALGDRLLLRRSVMPLLAYAGLAACGVGVARGSTDAFVFLVSVVCAMLGGATGTAWDLLVSVARAKQAERAAGE